MVNTGDRVTPRDGLYAGTLGIVTSVNGEGRFVSVRFPGDPIAYVYKPGELLAQAALPGMPDGVPPPKTRQRTRYRYERHGEANTYGSAYAAHDEAIERLETAVLGLSHVIRGIIASHPNDARAVEWLSVLASVLAPIVTDVPVTHNTAPVSDVRGDND